MTPIFLWNNLLKWVGLSLEYSATSVKEIFSLKCKLIYSSACCSSLFCDSVYELKFIFFHKWSKHVVKVEFWRFFEKTEKPWNPHVSRLFWWFLGKNIRSCKRSVPKCPAKIFCVISGDFRGFRVRKRCFRVLLLTLFPRSPSL